MSEFEDVILPEDNSGELETDLPQSEELETVNTESETNTDELTDELSLEEEQLQEQPIEQQPQTIKVKFNHEEKELSLDEAIQFAQMGMNYPKLQERLQSLETDPRLSFVEELANEHGMDINEYLDTVSQARQQQKLDQLIQQNIPEELASEIIENRKFREQWETEQLTKAEEEKRNADYADFFEYFKQVNNRDYDPTKDQVPNEVWEAQKNGAPLRYAYMEHHNKQLQSQLQVLKQNKENAKRAPIGSLTNHGSANIESEDEFLKGFNSI